MPNTAASSAGRGTLYPSSRCGTVTHDADLQASTGLINRLLAGAGAFSLQKRYLRPDRSIVHVANTVSLIRHESKTPTTLVVAIDVTELRAAEAALKEANLQLADFQSTRDLALARTDAAGCFTAANDPFCRLVGRSEGEVLGSSVLEFTHPDDLEASRGLHDRLRWGGEPFQLEHRFVRPDGVAIWGH